MGLFDRIRRRGDSARPLASGTTTAIRDGLGGRWVNQSSGQGGPLDRHAHTEFAPPLPLPQTSIDALLEFQAIGRRIVNREPDDATREGYELEGMDPTMARRVEDAADGKHGLGVLSAIADARRWARAYGGGAILILANDGRPASEPLNRASLRSIDRLEVLDRHELPVHSWGLDPNDRETFGRPASYMLSADFARTHVVHASRVIPFFGNRLPRRIMIQRGGWGGSVLDLVWAELRNYATTNDYVTEAVTLLSQGVLKSKHLADAIDAGDQSQVIARLEAMRVAMGLLGDVHLDETETYEVMARPLNGLKDAVEAVTHALVAATDMPRSILLGLTPSGLNNGENSGEVRSWYDHVATLQPKEYEPALDRLLTLLMASRDGPTGGLVPDGWQINWAPLYQQSEDEIERINLTRAQRRALDVQSAVISNDEARAERALVELYGHNPAVPAPMLEPAAGPGAPGSEGLDDDAEVQPVTPAPLSEVPIAEPLISGAEAAARLGVSAGTIHRMAARGMFPAWRPGAHWRYAWSLIERAASTGQPAWPNGRQLQ